MVRRVPSDIPVGTQFSPGLVDLPALLRAFVEHSGDRDGLLSAVWEPGIRIKERPSEPSRRTRALPLEAATQYGLLTEGTWEATDLTRSLAALQPPVVYSEFARHILLKRGGLRLVEGAEQMRLDGLSITGDTLAQYLSDQGFRVTVHNTAINTMRMWLAKAGVFEGRTWNVNVARKVDLLGLSDETISALAGLNEEQRAFVEALCRINPSEGEDYPAARVREVAAQILGRSFGQSSLPQAVLEPLKRAGLIEYESGGTRGGKTSVLRTLPLFNRDVLESFVRETVRFLDPVLTAYFKKRPENIYAELESDDRHVKGQALEAYAIHIMRLLGLRFAGWRKRGPETGGLEVDVVMTGRLGLTPTVWQVQCKNTPSSRVRLEHVAREVGLALRTRATHIMILANCPIARDAPNFAKEVMINSPITVFLLDKTCFDRIRTDAADLASILREQADQILRVRHQALTSERDPAR